MTLNVLYPAVAMRLLVVVLVLVTAALGLLSCREREPDPAPAPSSTAHVAAVASARAAAEAAASAALRATEAARAAQAAASAAAAAPAGSVAPASTTDGEWTVGIVEHKPAPVSVALLRDVRVARHDGFDRLAFEFTGPPPGYHVEYVDRPVRDCGEGSTIPLAGEAWLQVKFEPANAHTEEGKPTIAERARKPALPIVKEGAQICDFEAQVIWAFGLSRPNAYRVSVLREPHRVVVDVKH